MKRMTKIFLLAIALSCSRMLVAEEKAQTNDLAYFYDAEMFQWNYSLFGGLTLNFHNQSAMTVYGIKDSMKDALMQYDDSRREYSSYRRKTISGSILTWGGLAAVCLGLPILRYFDFSADGRDIAIGVMLGGFVFDIIGLFVWHSGQENIFTAVNLYNRHKITDAIR
jgi:hypothetical protein